MVRHELVPGHPIDGSDAGQAVELARFLQALHAVPLLEAVRHGLAPTADKALLRDQRVRFHDDVLPLLPAASRASANAVLAKAGELTAADVVIHGDLGPEHLLAEGLVLTGVIDFGDARGGDAALDCAWPLHGASPAFASAFGAEYAVTEEVRDRALTWHQLGPWYEVVHGLDINDPATVEDGLAGVQARLPLDQV